MGVEERIAKRLGPTVRVGLGTASGIPGEGPKIARCEGKAADGDVLMRTRRGGVRNKNNWSPKVQRVSATSVRREATRREVLLNYPWGTSPAVGS